MGGLLGMLGGGLIGEGLDAISGKRKRDRKQMRKVGEDNMKREKEIYHSILQKWVAQGMKGLDIIIKGRLGDIGKGRKIKSSQTDYNNGNTTYRKYD